MLAHSPPADVSAGEPLLIRAMGGLGDGIYQRPFIRHACSGHRVFLETPWPELYTDLPLEFVKYETALRTQRKNVARQPKDRYVQAPRGVPHKALSYGAGHLARGSILQALECFIRLEGAPLVMDLPPLPLPKLRTDRPIAFVRPATLRREWRNEARAPKPEYIAELAARLSATHHIVSVADLEDGEEWLMPPAPKADTVFHRGELSVLDLLALMKASDLVIGGVGWIVPTALALKKKAFVVLGGQGAFNAPEKITDPRLNLSHIGFAMPQRFCRCTDMKHQCNKTIPDLQQQFSRFLSAC